MKVTRAIRMEFERKDKPFDAYEAAMSEKEASARLPDPVPRRHSFSRELPLPFDDARCAEFCADMPAWARSMRAEAAEKEAGGSAVEVALKVGKACAAVRDDY